jgi:UDP-glucose 4-epimerase
MKNILVVGKNSYIGDSFAFRAKDDFHIDIVDSIDNHWKEVDFSKYDVVFHVAGLAHIDAKNDMQSLYYKINRDLAIEVAKYSKENGVKQFIFMSSMIVYGESKSLISQSITKDTKPKTNGFYGDSKLQAENGILPLQSDEFNVVVLRPPMIYGKGCKGNYPRLVTLAKKLPIFPNYPNQRSMLHIDNLCEILKLIIVNESKGIFFPQNKEYTNVADMVQKISIVNGKKIRLTKAYNWMIKPLSRIIGQINKVFGTLIYDKEMSNHFDWKYIVKTLDESIKEDN